MTTTVLRGGDLVDRAGVDVVVADGWIREVVPSRPLEDYGTVDVLDATGMLVIPGLINNHTHGTAFGPLFPSGHEGLSHAQVLANLDRHLLEGTTTVLCVDGFVTADALARTNDAHPVTVKLASCNTPAACGPPPSPTVVGSRVRTARSPRSGRFVPVRSRSGRSAPATPSAGVARATCTSPPRSPGGPA